MFLWLFSDTGKLREFVASSPALQEMLKDTLLTYSPTQLSPIYSNHFDPIRFSLFCLQLLLLAGSTVEQTNYIWTIEHISKNMQANCKKSSRHSLVTNVTYHSQEAWQFSRVCVFTCAAQGLAQFFPLKPSLLLCNHQ